MISVEHIERMLLDILKCCWLDGFIIAFHPLIDYSYANQYRFQGCYYEYFARYH